ncbi:MAG: DNA pilot protein [Microviridae sp.]|nr:MAG: DNA pilot protein [Microviridae sp.]
MDYGSLATAGAQLLGSVLGSTSNANLNRDNRKWQAQQATIAYNRQRNLIQDFYTPSAQINSYRAAGINPNYVLQNNSLQTGSTSAPQAETAQTYASGDILQRGISGAAMSVFQADNLKSQTNKNNAESNKINLMTPKELEKLGYDSETAKSIAEYSAQNQEMDLQLKNQELQLKTAQTAAENAMANVYHWDALNKQFEFENIKPAELQQIQTSINKDLAQIGLLVAQKQLTEEEAKLAIANTYKTYMDAVSNRIAANAAQTGANAQMLNAQVNQAEMPSRIDMNYSQSELNTANAGKVTVETQGAKIDVSTKRQAQKFVVKSMETSCEILGKENRWFNARQVGGMIKDVGVGVGSAVGGFASAATSIGKLGM